MLPTASYAARSVARAQSQDIPELGYRNPYRIEQELMAADPEYRAARLSVRDVFMEPTLSIDPDLACSVEQRSRAGVLWFLADRPPAKLAFYGPAVLVIVPRLVLCTW